MDNENFDKIIEQYKSLDEVKAIAIGGSSSAKTADSVSDIDVYIFCTKNIPVEKNLYSARHYALLRSKKEVKNG